MGFVQYAALSDPDKAQLLATYVPLGQHPKTGDMFARSDVDAFSGTYLLGVAGSGKSGQLQNMICASAAKGDAIIVLDPHGDLIDKCVASLPPERLANTYVLDMLDEEHPFGVNVFGLSGIPRTLKEKSQAIDRVTHVFNVLWPETRDQANLPMYVRTATIALISNPGMTLTNMRQFLIDKQFRDSLLRNVTDQTVHEHWAEHDRLTQTAQDNNIQPLLRRLSSLFVGHDLIQQILGQPTTISFRRAIEEHQIIFIKLPTTELPEQARTLGIVIVAQISAALFSFAELPEYQRPPFSLFMDEFQNFVSKDIERFVTEGRKFGIRLTVAHQLRSQLDKDLKAATAAMRTKVCFQVKADDSKEMAEYFPAPDTGRLAEVEAHATAALLKDPGSDSRLRRFTDQYLRPLQSQRKGGKVKMEQAGPGLVSLVWRGLDVAEKAAKKAEPIEEDDPTQYLDQLFLDVMRSRNPDLPIPPKAVMGFANIGDGFHQVVRGLKMCQELTASYQFPEQLIAGSRWVLTPRNARERFLHFIFTLRQAMRALAENPMGKKAEASTAAVAQLLTQLPRRQALVRSGDEVGRIVTYDTPLQLEGVALAERVGAIQAQTRARYCHSHQQVQQLWRMEREPVPVGRPTPALTELFQVAGWVEVGEP